MDPVTFIAGALAAGAAAGLEPTAAQAVKDVYAGLKRWIQDRYDGVGLDGLETKPGSKARRDLVAEDLQEAGANADLELLERAKLLLDAVGAETPGAVGVSGILIEDVEAQYLRVRKVAASGPGVVVRRTTLSGGIDAEGVSAGLGSDTGKKA